MNDHSTPIAELKALIEKFVAERDWHKFHSPKNISMSMAIEVAELMEHFQWLTPDESRQIANDPQELHAVGEELADVICYALSLANALQLDVAQTVAAKMKKNELKYPAGAG